MQDRSGGEERRVVRPSDHGYAAVEAIGYRYPGILLLPYWLLFGLFAFGSMSRMRHGTAKSNATPLLGIAIVVILLFVGLRYQTGGDWKNYDEIFFWTGSVSTEEAMKFGDPGYTGLNLIAHALNVEIWLVNLVCATLFCWGLFCFVTDQPLPWLACAVAVPYLVIVVVMGYTRQGVAIGMLMAAIPAFQRGHYVRFALYFVVAILFHKSAVAILPIMLLSISRHRLVAVLAAAVLGGVGIGYLLSTFQSFVDAYVGTDIESSGAFIRIAMNLVAAVVFLPLQRRFASTEQSRLLFRNFAILTLILTAALPLSTTAVDRTSLYLFPFQIFVLSRLPLALSSTGRPRPDVVIGVLLYMATIQFTWLSFADNAHWWLPYQMI